ncbi:hypothetical protein RhiJN_00879 [Ceratobasidium sp. AG-Ba]|nr:hypothetical protein RhiJN_00879 [Ceratobasidium sp. AG-Ba]
MSYPPRPDTSMLGRARSMSSPARPSVGAGPKWISSAAPLKRPARHFAAFDLGFIPLTGATKVETSKTEKCYEELEEEPDHPPTPCVKLKDGRELRPLLKHRKRSATHHIPGSARWDTALPTSASSSSLSALGKQNKPSPDNESEPSSEHEHAHVHFSEALENVCVFDESAPAHDADPTHSPLEPPRRRATPPPASPRIRTKQLRLPGTVIASPSHKAALGFTGASEDGPCSASPPSATRGHDMHLKLACDSSLPSPEHAPSHGMIKTLDVHLSPQGDKLVGLVRVRNVGFEKQVCVIYTADEWATRREVGSRWIGTVPNRPDGWDDFEFSVPLADLGIQASAGTVVRAKFLRFAIRYRAPGQGEWWDNHNGANWVARFRAVNSDF